MLTTDKNFKEAVDFAIINYGKVDIIYKCGYLNDLTLHIPRLIETFKRLLTKHIPFRLSYQVTLTNDLSNICKLIIFIPSKRITNIETDVIKLDDNLEYSIPELIDKMWLEAISFQQPIALVNLKPYMSKNYIYRSGIDNFKQISNDFNMYLPTEEKFKESIDSITALLLESISLYGNERIDFFKYTFEVPEDVIKDEFIAYFKQQLTDAFECNVLIVPDIKLKGPNTFDLFVLFPLYEKFDLNNFSMQDAVRNMWYRTLFKFNKRSLDDMFSLKVNFVIRYINRDLNTLHFTLGLYKINRKVLTIYRATIDNKYKNFIVDVL